MVPALLALLVAASPPAKTPRITHAEPSGPAPLILAGVDDAVALCRRITPAERLRPEGDGVEQGERLGAHAAARDEAIVSRYAITVPGGQLAFAPFDGPERTLSVVEPAVITLGRGRLRMWATEDRALPVAIDAAGARRILAAQRAGALSLRLVFDLPDDATCGSDVRGKRWGLGVEPVDWTWLDGETPLARGGASGDRPAVGVAQGAEPTVDVGEPIAGPPGARKAVLAHRAALLGCYQRALEQDPGLDGLVVVDLGPRIAVAADSTGSSDLTACVERTLAPLAAVTRRSVPIRFELAAPGSSAGAAAIPPAGDAGASGEGAGR